ncbi:hypothetical protein FJY68_06440 [candidate division WOR-3 bacterium]|uniref:Uncharacterized protein n=1 Tax=candidate division WOR-3 bacterium TaxID=2052148 RepID=A0A937XEB7_UNCW3|nr:hypothetical protein [candidate division WOR-3 bacterium]
MAERQENCYACGQHVRARAYRHHRRANPVVIIAVCVAVVSVLGVFWFSRANAARKQAALLAEEAALIAQDSVRRANRQWLDAVRVAKDDEEVRARAAAFDDLESRYNSVRLRAAAAPTSQQESIIRQVESEFALLHHSAIVLGSSPAAERQASRDSIQMGMRRVEDLTRSLGE